MSRRRSNRSPLWRLPVDREVDEELAFHLDMRIREYLEQGLTEDAARRRALERFGDPRGHAAACRQQARGRNRRWRALQLLDELGQDLRFGLRQLRRRPLLAVCLVGLLAVGLGATTAVCVLLDQALLTPPPYRDPDRLVTLWEQDAGRGKTKNSVSPANFLAWHEETASYQKMAGFITITASLTGEEGPPQRIKARIATEGYLDLLGLPVTRGRAFLPEDFAEGAEPAVVLSERLWRNRFGGGDIVGQTVTINAEAHRILGVMPAASELDMGPAVSPYGDAADLYSPLRTSESWRQPRGRWLMVLARLAPGVELEQARADLERVMTHQRERHPDFNTGWSSQVVPLSQHLREPMRLALIALFGAVLLVLMIVCMNASSLMVGHTLGRGDELAVRRALGAGRRRLLRQLLVEGAVVVGAAAVLAWLLARGVLQLVRATFPSELLPAHGVAGAGAGAGWVTLALAGFCVLLFGLLPGVMVSLRPRQLARTASLGTSRRRHRLRTTLVFAQVVLALVLLVGAGLMLKTVRGLLAVDPGFHRGGVVSFGVSAPADLEDARAPAFFDQLLERLGALPGVSSTGAITHMPMASLGAATSYYPADRPEPEPGQKPVADIRILRGAYLRTLGIPLIAGRAFDLSDRAGSEPGSILISDSLARRHWPGESALGRQVVVSWGDPGPRTVVGVVGDVRHADLLTEPRDAIYFPQEQEPESVMNVVLGVDRRAGGSAAEHLATLAPTLREVVAGLDPSLPIFDLRSVDGVIAGSLSKQRFLAGVLGVFAALALGLAALGIYGVTALAVTQSTREIGLRMALGAAPWEVAGLFLRRTATLTGLALAIGLGASVLLGRTVESLFFGVRSHDPATLTATALVLAAAALVAALIPTRRAARLDPTRALRWE